MVETSLAAVVDRYTTGLRRSGPYRPPSPQEVALASSFVAGLAVGDPSAAAALGLRTVPAADGRVALLPPSPGEAPWVVLVLTPGVVPSVLVEVPHPYADLHTEVAGLGLASRLPGAVLLQAGAHRVASAVPGSRRREDCPADVAARPDALFSRLADGLVARLGVAQVQWHGFADRPGVDVVASPGAAAAGPLLASAVARLGAQGFRVLGGDDAGMSDLAGRRNVQGLAAAAAGTPFVHLELSRSVRSRRERLDAAVDAVAGAVRVPP